MKEYRYTKGKEREKEYNLHVKEMIAMIKNEEVKTNLYVKGVKLSNHAYRRFCKHVVVCELATATRHIKMMLKNSTRIGSVLSYDGRINVLYAHDRIAIFMTPDLKKVVTVNKYDEVSYQPILKMLSKSHKLYTKQDIIDLHISHIEKIELEEKQQMNRMLEIDSQVCEANELYAGMLSVIGGRKGTMQIREMISGRNHELKIEGWKLFDISVRKRHLCKSLVALY